MKKKIVVVTASRAEWGLLRPLVHELNQKNTAVTVLVTGSHLHLQSGFSCGEISDGDAANIRKVYIIPDNPNLDGKKLMFATMANALTLIAEELQNLAPDLVVVLGDRYEIFAVATACRLSGILLAHISGGELTSGAFDDSLRHCITKLSDIHFTATDDYRKRVIQLGEHEDRVFNVGELALNKISCFAFKDRSTLPETVKIPEGSFFLLTLHPETCNPGMVSNSIDSLAQILLTGYPDKNLIFTGANADPEGEKINEQLQNLASKFPDKVFYFPSFGRANYLSIARMADCVIGNSSSGIIEVPAIGTPVINLGRRQCGRPHGESVISVPFAENAIKDALQKVSRTEFREMAKKCASPYDGENSAAKIASIICDLDFSKIEREKIFCDLKL